MPNVSPSPAPNRADLSQFLVHLTKDGTHEIYNKVNNPITGYFVTNRTVQARTSLIQILTNKVIEAKSPFGYFKMKVNRQRHPGGPVWNNGGLDPAWLMSVCFSETPLKELRHFYTAVVAKRNRYKKYGVGFWQDFVRTSNGNPVAYIDSRRPDLLQALDCYLGQQGNSLRPMMHLSETFGPLVIPGVSGYSDFRWEREWRTCGNLTFSFPDLAFGICPAAEIQYFSLLTGNTVPFLDPDWDEITLRNHLQSIGSGLLNYL